MRSARPIVSLLIALASGTAGLAIGMWLGMRDTDPLYFLLIMFTWGLAGTVVGLAARAGFYAAFLTIRQKR
jgi:fatty acid desaturase